MRNFIIWFSIIGKHLLKNPLIPVFVVLIPIICAVSTIYHKNNVQSAYRAGIYIDGNDHVSRELMPCLNMTVRMNSLNTMMQMIYIKMLRIHI